MEIEEKLESQSVYAGKIINVRVDSIGLSGGRTSTREVVEHRNAVVIIPMDSEDNVILVRQYRYAVGQFLLEAPAGIIELGESPTECAERELQEEIGFFPQSLRPLGGFWSSPGFCDEYMYVFLAENLVESKLDEDYDENIMIEKIPLSRINSLIKIGEIEDGKTIAAMLMANSAI